MKKKIIIFSIVLLIIVTGLSLTTYALTNNLLEPGDNLIVTVWGHPDLESEVIININGYINLPLLEEIQAEDKSIIELKSIIIKNYKQFIKNPQVNILLKEKASIQVVIMGEVFNPGSYKLNPSAGILDLISRAGGITKRGNLKQANLIRDGQEVSLDLDGILRGNNNTDDSIKLENGDIVFVPENIIKVSILGEVNRPGRYEIVNGLRLSDLLAKAGSITNDASKVINYNSEGKTTSIDLVKLFTNDLENNPVLKNGDSIFVPETNYSVSILGEVNSPGSYNWNPDMRLTELIALAENVTERADLNKIRITDKNGNVKFINLEKYYEENYNEENLLLNKGDMVMVAETSQFSKVTILGEINRPGTYNWDQNLRLSELIATAGNLSNRGDTEKIKIIHNDGSHETFNFNEFIDNENDSSNPRLAAGDVVVIDEVSSPNWSQIFGFVTGFNAIKTLLEITW